MKIPMISLPRTQAFILAGGSGERLLPLTAFQPKPAIPFGGTFRIVDFTLSNCWNSAISQVALLTQYRYEQLHAYIRSRWGALWNGQGDARSLLCLPPTSGKRYRGTADAMFQNLSIIESVQPECVLILCADHVYNMNYLELLARHMETDADVTIGTIEYPIREANHFGVIEVDRDSRVKGFQEKPSNPRSMPLRPNMALVNMGVYAFKTEVLIQALFRNCERAFRYDFGHHVIPSLMDSARVYAHDFRDEESGAPRYWRDIGTIDTYYEASMDFIRPGSSFKPNIEDHWQAPFEAPNCRGNARVRQSVLSPGVRIEQDASVEDSVLLPGVYVGRGARVRRAIIQEGIEIPANFDVGWDLQQDRQHYVVTPKGVVVVSENPAVKPTFFVLQEKSVLGAKWTAGRGHARHVA